MTALVFKKMMMNPQCHSLVFIKTYMILLNGKKSILFYQCLIGLSQLYKAFYFLVMIILSHLLSQTALVSSQSYLNLFTDASYYVDLRSILNIQVDSLEQGLLFIESFRLKCFSLYALLVQAHPFFQIFFCQLFGDQILLVKFGLIIGHDFGFEFKIIAEIKFIILLLVSWIYMFVCSQMCLLCLYIINQAQQQWQLILIINGQYLKLPKDMLNNFKPNQMQWRTSQQLNPSSMYKSPYRLQTNQVIPPTYNVEKENQLHLPKNIPINTNNIKSKPLISPKTNQTVGRTSQNAINRNSIQIENTSRYNTKGIMPESRQNRVVCLNHQTKMAEYLVKIGGGEEEHYCARCAAQFAIKKSIVIKIDAAQGMAMVQSSKNQLPSLPQYQNEPIYQQILSILKLCNNVIDEHNINIQQFNSLENTYQQQIYLTTTFYDRLIEIIEEMKGDHLNDLIAQSDKYTQIADISNDYLRQNIIEINVIKNDIEDHIEEVLQGIKETGDIHECKESLEHYRQKITVFRHQTEEHIDSIQGVTHYSQNQIDNMIHSFQKFLETMWDQSQPQPVQTHQPPIKNINKNVNSAMTVKNIHQILPKGVSYQNCEGKKAFRNLQDDQDGDLQERKSPNFKRI